MKNPLRLQPPPSLDEFQRDPYAALRHMRTSWLLLIRRGRVQAIIGACMIGWCGHFAWDAWAHRDSQPTAFLWLAVQLICLAVNIRCLVMAFWMERQMYGFIAEIDERLDTLTAQSNGPARTS